MRKLRPVQGSGVNWRRSLLGFYTAANCSTPVEVKDQFGKVVASGKKSSTPVRRLRADEYGNVPSRETPGLELFVADNVSTVYVRPETAEGDAVGSESAIQVKLANAAAAPTDLSGQAGEVEDLRTDLTTTQENLSQAQQDIGALQAGGHGVRSETDSTTLVAEDAGGVVVVTKGSAATVTVPKNADEDIPVGARVTVIQGGAGQVTIVAATDVTVSTAAAGLKMTGANAVAELVHTSTDTWVAVGDLGNA